MSFSTFSELTVTQMGFSCLKLVLLFTFTCTIICSLVVFDREFTVTPGNMCGISLYLKLCEFQYLF